MNIQRHPTPLTWFNPWRFIFEMPLENSHKTPDWCNYMQIARNSPNNGFHVVYSKPDLKTRDLQFRNWDFLLFSQFWSFLLILLLKLDATTSYTQKEIHRHISHETCIANHIQNIKNNEYFVSFRPASSCSGLNRQPLSTVVQTRRTRRTWQLGCHVGNPHKKIWSWGEENLEQRFLRRPRIPNIFQKFLSVNHWKLELFNEHPLLGLQHALQPEVRQAFAKCILLPT